MDKQQGPIVQPRELYSISWINHNGKNMINYIYVYIYIYIYLCVCLCVLCQCSTLYDPMGCSPPGSSVHGIFQTRVLEWFAIFYFRRSSWPRGQNPHLCISCIGRQILYQLRHLGSHRCVCMYNWITRKIEEHCMSTILWKKSSEDRLHIRLEIKIKKWWIIKYTEKESSRRQKTN